MRTSYGVVFDFVIEVGANQLDVRTFNVAIPGELVGGVMPSFPSDHQLVCE